MSHSFHGTDAMHLRANVKAGGLKIELPVGIAIIAILAALLLPALAKPVAPPLYSTNSYWDWGLFRASDFGFNSLGRGPQGSRSTVLLIGSMIYIAAPEVSR